MSVATFHPDYLLSLPFWSTARDVVSGGDNAIKKGGTKYLPRLDSQSDTEYQNYLNRAFFFNATGRTVSGYLGMIFRKDPVLRIDGENIHYSDALSYKGFPFSDVDLRRSSFASYASQAVFETLVVGRAGTLIDWQQETEDRPYLSFYLAENILNWKEIRLNGRSELALLVLKEFIDASPSDFSHQRIEQLRVFKLIPINETFVVQVQLWRRDDANWVLINEIIPQRLGKPLHAIPFVFHGPRNTAPDVQRAPIDDLIAANLLHFRLVADYVHGLHYTALPTAWFSGFDNLPEIRIGSSSALVTAASGASAGFLEYKGEGLGSFERALDRVERILAILGSRLLEEQKRSAESAEALAIRSSGEQNIVALLARSTSTSLTLALKWVAWWLSSADSPGEIPDSQMSISLNQDFQTSTLKGSELQALVAGWQAGALTDEALQIELRKGEIG